MLAIKWLGSFSPMLVRFTCAREICGRGDLLDLNALLFCKGDNIHFDLGGFMCTRGRRPVLIGLMSSKLIVGTSIL